MTGLQWLGASVMLPQLPVFLRDRGASDGLVGLIVAMFFVSGVILQYPIGRFADRFGRRPVLLGGLVCFALATVAFVAPVSPAVSLLFRCLQGAGAGAAQVAALAMVAATVPPEWRGRAFGSVYGSQLAGMAVGPLIGSAVSNLSMTAVFAVSGVASLVACLPVLGWVMADKPVADAHRSVMAEFDPPAPGRASAAGRRAIAGAVMTAATFGLTVGVYETCWTLLLRSDGAASWQVGLSWTLFALAFVLMARPGGWLADHFDRRGLVVVTVGISLACCTGYPFLGSIALVIALGAVEAVVIAVAIPAVQSLLNEAAGPARYGRVQGLFATGQTSTTAVAAGISGSLFGVVRWMPFVLCAAVGAGLAALLPLIWRPVPGRVETRYPNVR